MYCLYFYVVCTLWYILICKYVYCIYRISWQHVINGFTFFDLGWMIQPASTSGEQLNTSDIYKVYRSHRSCCFSAHALLALEWCEIDMVCAWTCWVHWSGRNALYALATRYGALKILFDQHTGEAALRDIVSTTRPRETALLVDNKKFTSRCVVEFGYVFSRLTHHAIPQAPRKRRHRHSKLHSIQITSL